MGEWQHIETAPEGRAILVFDGRAVYAAEKPAYPLSTFVDLRRWFFITGDGVVMADEPQPTHWMPLPDAP